MVACVFTSVRKKEIRQFSTMTEDILQLVSWLKETDCEMAAMESTGSYWKPVYNIFEEEEIPTMIVNAQHIKGVPGRKTDVKDAEWIADLVRHGLVKASYIPNHKAGNPDYLTGLRIKNATPRQITDKRQIFKFILKQQP